MLETLIVDILKMNILHHRRDKCLEMKNWLKFLRTDSQALSNSVILPNLGLLSLKWLMDCLAGIPCFFCSTWWFSLLDVVHYLSPNKVLTSLW